MKNRMNRTAALISLLLTFATVLSWNTLLPGSSGQAAPKAISAFELTLEDRPLRLKQILRNVNSRQALVCMFLALLEMVRLQAIQLRQDRLFGEILLRKHAGFEAMVAEPAAVHDCSRMRPPRPSQRRVSHRPQLSRKPA